MSKEVLKKCYIICPLLPSSTMFTHHSTSARLSVTIYGTLH
nr:MAG TPA: hypothetical protein [Caudoviricetes sp.]